MVQLGLGVTSGNVTVKHNTLTGQVEHGLIGLNESVASYAGLVAECSSNLVVGDYVIDSHGATQTESAVDSVTLASHNATVNGPTGTNHYNTSTSQSGVVGYTGLKQSVNSPFPNSAIGLNDVALTADLSAVFVYPTRTFEMWAETLHGTDGTIESAIAYAVANPTEATAADTGVLDWVMAGHKVKNLSLKDAGRDGVTIGAMEYVAPASTGSIGIGDLFGNIFGNVFGDLEPPITGY